MAPCMEKTEVDFMNRIMESCALHWIGNTLIPLTKSQKPFDLSELCTRFIFDNYTYMESAFEFTTKEEDFNIIQGTVNHFRRFFDGMLPSTRHAKRLANDLNSFAQTVIDTHRQNEKKDSTNTFIKAIADSNGPFKNDKEHVDEIIDLIMGSTLTTGSFLSSILDEIFDANR